MKLCSLNGMPSWCLSGSPLTVEGPITISFPFSPAYPLHPPQTITPLIPACITTLEAMMPISNTEVLFESLFASATISAVLRR